SEAACAGKSAQTDTSWDTPLHAVDNPLIARYAGCERGALGLQLTSGDVVQSTERPPSAAGWLGASLPGQYAIGLEAIHASTGQHSRDATALALAGCLRARAVTCTAH